MFSYGWLMPVWLIRSGRRNLFSDRPQRIVGHEPTEAFVAQWAVGEDSFAANPPHAALSILTGTAPQDIILELMSPRLEGSDLVCDVKVLQGNEKATGKTVSLFIDSSTGTTPGTAIVTTST